jgi:ATP-dependent helicase HrpB
LQPLPIDSLLPEILDALRRRGAVVVEAPPGAGKTTRVPRAILEGSLAGEGEVLVLEPRRLAARMAARRVAEEIGDRVGGIVGYQVRFEDATGPGTRLRYVTEGLFTRRLASAPTLPGVGAVVLDEFHERRLHADLALAAVRRLRETARPDLKVVVMSATLDAGPVARHLGAPTVRSEGRLFDVAVEYLSLAEAAEPGVRLETRVARAVRRLAADEPGGDILVFLPGMAEIRGAMEACEDAAVRSGLQLLPLHGDLSPDDQDRAVRNGPGRKAIFSTNVAETSVTIEGVAAVVDSGLARVASHSPWSGLPLLAVRKVSKASAAQRAGRAGRTRPGRALRLYTRQDHDARPAFDVPEILREDLAEIMLVAAVVGTADRDWLDPPPEAAVGAANGLLRLLGAVDAAGRATDLGRRMLRFPLHPRLSRLLVEAEARGAAGEGALLAALLAERDIRERAAGSRKASDSPTGLSDLTELARRFGEAERVRFAPDRVRSLGLSPAAVTAVARARRQLLGIAGSRGGEENEEVALRAALAAFPDRVARRRVHGSPEVLLAGGGAARLDPSSVVREAPLLVAVDAGERRGESRPTRGAAGGPGGPVTVRLASAITPGMLAALFPERLRREDDLDWNAGEERVEGWARLRYGDLVIEERRKTETDPAKASALLAEAAVARGAAAFVPEGAIERLQARLEFVARAVPESGVAPLSEEDIGAALRESCAGRRSFAELRDAGLIDAVLRRIPPARRGALDRMAPERISLAGGRSTRVHYGAGGKPPHVESRLQYFFGLAEGPAVAGGRVRLVLHLLAPNMRAVQVTTDLAGFWERHYPALRRELMRRYPRHAWPEDPRLASPPGSRRRGG